MTRRIYIGLPLALLALLGVLLLALAVNSPARAQTASYGLEGWAWSDTIGWISFSCEDGGPSGSNICNKSSYGIAVSPSGVLFGDAWSDNVGWIHAGSQSGCPSGECLSKVVDDKIFGWMQARAGGTPQSGGWDGWISLAGTGYGVRVGNGGTLSGFAWGDTNVGWVDFSRAKLKAACNNGLSYDLYGPACACPAGQSQSGSVCLPNQCSGVNEDPNTYPSCTCLPGYEKDGGVCTLLKPTLSISTVPSGRARGGSQVTVNWDAKNVTTDGSESCAVTSAPSGTFAATYDPEAATGVEWQGSGGFLLRQQTVLTLSCKNTITGASLGAKSVTIGLIPTFDEI